MTDKILKSTDFKTAEVFDCGLDNRDPQRGYRKSRPVQNTEIFQMLAGNDRLEKLDMPTLTPVQDASKDR